MKLAIFSCALLAAIAFPRLATAAGHDHEGNSPKFEVHLTDPLTVGTQTIKPGDYKFQCLTIDNQHFLVVLTQVNEKEVARVPCKPEDLKSKIDASEFRFTTADGKRVLTEVRIKGESIAHKVATN